MTALRRDILPEAQKALWPALQRMPEGFVLHGGTAIALRLGHRQSEDFDYFARRGFEPDRQIIPAPPPHRPSGR